MGCDIHSHAERKVDGKWQAMPGIYPFDWRDYGIFGFLANVRNYSEVQPIAPPRGLPSDVSAETRKDYEGWDGNAHSSSWLSVDELANYDYDQNIEDRRVMRNGDGVITAEPGDGERMPLREFLGDGFFRDIESLKTAGAERVVFWFDN